MTRERASTVTDRGRVSRDRPALLSFVHPFALQVQGRLRLYCAIPDVVRVQAKESRAGRRCRFPVAPSLLVATHIIRRTGAPPPP